MASQFDKLAAAAAAGGHFAQVPIPSREAADNVRRVEAMQVRTQAGAFASQVLAGKQPSVREWVAFARVVECYIRGEAIDDAGPAPLQPNP